MVITVSNQKGGTGKSTTAAAIATGATFKGKTALAIDLDPQCNLSFMLGANPLQAGAFELITGKADAEQLIQTTPQCSVISGNISLASADTILNGNDRVNALKTALNALKSRFDVIVVDTPPTLGTLLINALTASDEVVIPIQADVLSLQGLFQLLQTIKKAQTAYNPTLNVTGVLFTKHSNRTVVSRDVADAIKNKASEWGVPVLSTFIREGVAVRESQMLRQSLFEYAPKSNPAKDYLSFLEEIGI